MTASLSLDTLESRDDAYATFLREGKKALIPVIKIKHKGAEVALLIKMDPNCLENPKKKSRKILEEWGCGTCLHRYRKLMCLVDKNGKPVFANIDHPSKTELQKELNQCCKEYISTFDKEYPFNWGLEVVKEDTLFALEEGRSEDGTPFYHYAFTPSSVTELKEVELLEKAFHKYIPLLSRLLRKSNNLNNLHASCEAIIKLLNKATYGHKQVASVEWFTKLIKELLEHGSRFSNIPFYTRMAILARFIGSASIVEGDSNSAHMGFYHTLNNFIWDILENGTTPEGVVRLIEERNNPSNYRRKSGKIKDAHIEAAKKFLSGKKNTVETTEELEEHTGCVKINDGEEEEECGSTAFDDAFSGMKRGIKKEGKRNEMRRSDGFAQRMALSKVLTLNELLRMVEEKDVKKVEIDTVDMSPVYTAKTTINKEDLAFPHLGHLWSFMNSSRNKQFGINPYDEVTHIYLIKTVCHHNILFIIKNSRETLSRHPIMENCMIPEFFAAKHRAAEQAIEELNRRTVISIPSGDLAFGVGTSVSKQVKGTFTNTLKFRLTLNDGRKCKVKINKLE